MDVVRRLDYYPTASDVPRLLRAFLPQLVFLSLEAQEEAFAVARSVEEHSPGLPTVAINPTCDQAILLAALRAGVREFLHSPFEAGALREALLRLHQGLARAAPAVDSTDILFAFLPAKGGVGASTIALNTSAAMAELPDTPVLLIDFDLTSGMIRFMTKLETSHSVIDAAENAKRLDEQLWRQLISSTGGFDVLPSGTLIPGFRIEPAQIRAMLDFARRRYKAICVDLSGNMEKYSIEIMHESKRIFLVCTSELPALHLAQEKADFLRGLGLAERVGVLLNRCDKRDRITVAEVEKLLGLPVQMTFPNDYARVHKALEDGKPIARSTELGKRFGTMAEDLMGGKPVEVNRKRSFVEYFSIRPQQYSGLSPRKKSAT